ncbi:uncharacterized protein VTP21DRAFT_2053 [Calcarisporiella thermophila]|uniref:uncharacterized protein n=1 Tax=Calcarisporiella thermophila TaxID=911321 RepID=UPI0037435A02
MPRNKSDQSDESPVAIANKATDIISFLGSSKEYTKNGLDLVIDYFPFSQLSDELREWTFQLVKSNMYTLYANSNDGWNDSSKRREMSEEHARYLIAKQKSDGTPVGFVYFQFTYEETMDDNVDAEVIYCYEIQVIPEATNKGLGEHMMRLMENIGRHWGMEKSMLTVFKANERAFKFYKERLGYQLDEISPSVCLPPRRARRFDYEILSLRLQ